MIQSNKNMRRPGIEPGSTAWKAAMLTIIPPTPHIALGFYLDCSREQFLSKCVLEFLQVWINCWYCVLSWGYSSVVEQSAAVRQVHGSNPCVPYKFFSSNIYMFCQIWICNGRVILLELGIMSKLHSMTFYEGGCRQLCQLHPLNSSTQIA